MKKSGKIRSINTQNPKGIARLIASFVISCLGNT